MGCKEAFIFTIKHNESSINPLDIQFKLDEPGYIEISLLNESGRLTYNFADYYSPGDFNHKVFVKDLDKGKYFLRIARNGMAQVKELKV